jgi:endo-1,4-beta-xylanase
VTVPGVRRTLRWLGWTAVALVAAVAVLAVATALTAPGRRGLPGAAQRVHEWEGQPPLRDLADRIGVRFGSAVMASDLRNDPQYGRVLAREFNSLTPFVEMKWGTIHPEPRRYDFAQADELVSFAAAHGMRVRGHTLVYGHVVDPPNPEYLSAAGEPAVLRAMMADHIRTVAGRYRGRVGAWDVVNEPLRPFGDPLKGGGLSDNVFTKTLGPGYIAEALRLARETDPGAQLFINDFGVLEAGPKQDRYFRLVEELREAGAPLDAVGFQAHMVPLLGPPPSSEEITSTLRRFAALGVKVEITELNVFTRTRRHLLTLGFTYDEAAELQRQAGVYAAVTRACLSVPACQGVTVWTFTDRYQTTIENLTHIDDIPLIFDRDYRPKPAAFALRDTLARTERRSSNGNPSPAARR